MGDQGSAVNPLPFATLLFSLLIAANLAGGYAASPPPRERKEYQLITPHMPEPSLELLIAAMQTELSRLGNGIVLRLMLLLRYLSSRGSVRILVLLLLLTLPLILLPLDLVSTGGYAVVMLLRVECHDAFLSNTTG
jgi:hypothetical protein